jgi:hypothetical protein
MQGLCMQRPLLEIFLAELEPWDKQRELQQQLQDLLQAGEFAQIEAFTKEIAHSAAPEDSINYWLNQILVLLANSIRHRQAALACFVRLLQLRQAPYDLSRLAALLVYRQPDELIIELLPQLSYAEFAYLLLHELLFRRLDCRDLADLLPHADLPLAALPLVLHPEIELEIDDLLPRFRSNGELERPSGPLFDLAWPALQHEQLEPLAQQVSATRDDNLRAATQQCFAAWRIDTACFMLEGVAEPLRLHAGMLLPLGIAALAEASVQQVWLAPISIAEVYRVLMRCCAYGGAYGDGALFARARLYVWQLFAAMLGLNFGTSFEQIAQQLLQSRFWFVQSAAPWFSQDYDCMLVSLSPDGRRLVSIAAASTD